MKITCQSCQAKYTIADEKVLGKIVKIRCKKCSSTIVVNGSDPSAAASYADEAAQVGAGGDEGWTVNVAEGDQRTMTDAEIVSAYQGGVIGAETYCWKDGMSDWLPLREIDVLFDACNATRAIPQAAPEPARAVARGGGAAPAPVEYAAASNGSGSIAPAAARRAGGRGAGADLFQGASKAGGDEEVMTSAPQGAPQAFDKPSASTGARNENSVLFSLSALTSKGSERPPAVPGAEASGLIDIRQLSAQMGRGDDKKRSRVDDIMNLSSGGAFNGALNTPVLSAPAMDQLSAEPATAAPPRAGKGIIFLAIGAAAVVIVAAVGATFMLTHKDTDATAASASAAPEAPSATVAAATATATTTATASAAPDTSAAATETAAAAAPTVTATAPAATTAAAPPATPPAQQAVAPSTPRPAPTHAEPRPAAAAPAAASEGAEFNMGEAKSRLAAAASAAQGCKKGDGPTGTGRVIVVFAPSGGAQSANVSGPPFEGTPTGACVAARFKGVRVPAFSGSPFSVSKSFTIN